MKQLPVKATTIKDIRGKELKYVIIGDDANAVIMNVGDKTYNAVKALTEPVLTPNSQQDGKLDNKNGKR